MKDSLKAKVISDTARDLFAEVSEGIEALAVARQGKRKLRTHSVERKSAPSLAQRSTSPGHGLRNGK